MKGFLEHRSNRWGYDGWALKHREPGTRPLDWTTCTSRHEARELRDELVARDPDLFSNFDPVKVQIQVKEVTHG